MKRRAPPDSLEFDADQQALAADPAMCGSAGCGRSIGGAQFGGALGQSLFHDDRQGLARDGAGEGAAAKGGAVVAGPEDAEDLARGQDGGDGVHAAGEGFAQGDHVRADTLVLAGQELARAAQARLDFIGNHQHVVPAAEFAHARAGNPQVGRRPRASP